MGSNPTLTAILSHILSLEEPIVVFVERGLSIRPDGVRNLSGKGPFDHEFCGAVVRALGESCLLQE